MKILHVSLLTPDHMARSGAGVVIHGQFQAMRHYHDITLVVLAPSTRAQAKAIKTLRAEGVNVHVLHERIPLPVIRIKRTIQDAIGRKRNWSAIGSHGFIDPALIHLVNRLIDTGKYDLLQIDNLGLPRLPTDRRFPTLLIEHEVRDAYGLQQPQAYDPQSALWQQADLIQVFTRADACAIYHRVPALAGRVRVNPFGVELSEEADRASCDDAGAFTVVFVGNFNHTPNVDAALWLGREIMPRVMACVEDAKLIIVGKDPPASVRKLASMHIAVIGEVPKIEPVIAGSAVVAVPVRQGGGMRVKTLQAMAHGRAVVSTSLGAEGLFGDLSDWPIIIADEAQTFAAAIVQLLSKPQQAAQLGAAARAFVATHHTWAAYRDRLEASYGELCAHSAGGAA